MGAGAKIGMKLLTIAVGIPVGIVVKRAVDLTWSAARPERPPRQPEDQNVRWGDAMGWAALSAAGVVAAEIATRRGADVAWRAITGTEPPPAKPGKAQKKLEKAEKKQARRGAS